MRHSLLCVFSRQRKNSMPAFSVSPPYFSNVSRNLTPPDVPNRNPKLGKLLVLPPSSMDHPHWVVPPPTRATFDRKISEVSNSWDIRFFLPGAFHPWHFLSNRGKRFSLLIILDGRVTPLTRGSLNTSELRRCSATSADGPVRRPGTEKNKPCERKCRQWDKMLNALIIFTMIYEATPCSMLYDRKCSEKPKCYRR